MSAEEAEEMAVSVRCMIDTALKSQYLRGLHADVEIMQHMHVCESLLAKKLQWDERLHSENTWAQWYAVGDFLTFIDGRSEEAEKVYEKALTISKKTFPLEHRIPLALMQSLGQICWKRGQMDDAEKWWKRAYKGYERSAPDVPPEGKFMVLQHLAQLHYGRGEIQEAGNLWTSALEGYEGILGPDHPETLNVVMSLGFLALRLDQIDKAEQLLRRFVIGTREITDIDESVIYQTLFNMGRLHRMSGDKNEARKTIKEILEGLQKMYKPDHPIVLEAVQQFAMVHYVQGELDKAEEMWNQALDAYESAVHPDQMQISMVVHYLGMLYWTLGDLKRAEAMLMRVLVDYEKTLVLGHPNTSTVLCLTHYWLGETLAKMDGRQDDAAKEYAKAQKQYEALPKQDQEKIEISKHRLEYLRSKKIIGRFVRQCVCAFLDVGGLDGGEGRSEFTVVVVVVTVVVIYLYCGPS